MLIYSINLIFIYIYINPLKMTLDQIAQDLDNQSAHQIHQENHFAQPTLFQHQMDVYALQYNIHKVAYAHKT